MLLLLVICLTNKVESFLFMNDINSNLSNFLEVTTARLTTIFSSLLMFLIEFIFFIYFQIMCKNIFLKLLYFII